MKIDRSRFLLLAAALSANACTIIDERSKADSAVDTDTGSDTADATSADTAVSDTADGAASDSVVTDAADASDATDAVDTSDVPMCTNEGGSPAACSKVTSCLEATSLCEDYLKYFKSKISQKAIDCLIAMPTCEGTVDIHTCGPKAFDDVCVGEDVDTYCTSLLAKCPSEDAGGADGGTRATLLADCKHYAPGLLEAGRLRLAEVLSTVDEGSCTTPLRDLLSQL
jgi:hypothetical protein